MRRPPRNPKFSAPARRLENGNLQDLAEGPIALDASAETNFLTASNTPHRDTVSITSPVAQRSPSGNPWNSNILESGNAAAAMFKSLWRMPLAVLVLLSQSLAYSPLSDDTLLKRLPQPSTADFDIHTGPLLAPILVPRVPGTPGSIAVLTHFVDFFHTSLPKWTVQFQNSTSKTPVHGDKDVPFVNLIATRDPPGTRPGDVGRLTLVAHYDSKIEPRGFIGATDSAAPCAMIMHAVRSIDDALTNKWASQADDLDLEERKGIQVLFLDGEEAFRSWTATDSIYGARALAEEWDNTYHPAISTYKNMLDSIELFVLLDLLGSPENLPIPSWMKSTHWSYVNMAEMEVRLRNLGLFKSASDRIWLPEKDKSYDQPFNSYYMQDDHIPFVARGVEVLHLIPQRFPSVWHTIHDDAEHLDIAVVRDWALLTAAFAAEYLELEGYFEDSGDRQAQKRWQDVTFSKTEL